MATRLYSGSSTAPAVSPAFGTYNRTSNAVRLACSTVKLGEAFSPNIQSADGAASTLYRILYYQWVSAPLAAQTILSSSTIKGVFRAACSNVDWAAGSNDGIGFTLAKCAEDGSSRTDILTHQLSTSTALTAGSVLTNQRIKNASTTPVAIGTNVTINDGDRLIVEIYLQEKTTNTGRTGRVECGDAHASDLAENDTGTDQFTPWVELSHDLVFDSGGDTTLDGAATADGTAAGDLSTAIEMAGAATGEGSAAADLATAIELSGTAQAEGNAAADLNTAIPLDGAATGEGNAAGDLSTGIEMSGAAIAEGAAAGDLSTHIEMSGDASAEATAEGSLEAPIANATGSLTSAKIFPWRTSARVLPYNLTAKVMHG